MANHWKRKASAAYEIALSNAVMNSVILLGDLLEENDEGAADCLALLKNLLVSGTDGQPKREELIRLRRENEARMQTVSRMQDACEIYKYAARRKAGAVSEASAQELIPELESFLSNSPDTMTLNLRVGYLMGELPVRLTRQSFYGKVEQAMKLYVGDDRENLENLYDQIRFSLLLSETAGSCVSESLNQLWSEDWKAMTPKRANELLDEISKKEELLEKEASVCLEFQMVLNNLLLLALTKEAAIRDVKWESEVFEMLAQLAAVKSLKELETLEESFESLEGIQERAFAVYESLGETQEQVLEEAWVDVLMGSSFFADIDKKPLGPAKQADVEAVMKAYIQEMDRLFSVCPKPLWRSVMAKTLSMIPVMFSSLSELFLYIENSLACPDLLEQEASVEQIRAFMESEYDV